MREIRHSGKSRGSCGAKNHYGGVEQWQLAGFMPRRSLVQIQPPQLIRISVLKTEYGEVAER